MVAQVKQWVAAGIPVFCVQESCGFGFTLHRELVVAHVKDQVLPKGLGRITTVSLDGEVCDWERFHNRKQIGSDTGCVSGRTHQRRFAATTWLGGNTVTSLFLLRGATIMTLNRSGINVSLGLLVIPLLVSGLPNLSLAALATSKRLVEIKLRQTPVGVDV